MALCESLSQLKCLEVEGVLRLSGSQTLTAQLKKAVIKAYSKDPVNIDLLRTQIDKTVQEGDGLHSVAMLLKQLLREMKAGVV